MTKTDTEAVEAAFIAGYKAAHFDPTGYDVDAAANEAWEEYAAPTAKTEPSAAGLVVPEEALFKCETCGEESNCHPLDDLALSPSGSAVCGECWDANWDADKPAWDDLPDYRSKFAALSAPTRERELLRRARDILPEGKSKLRDDIDNLLNEGSGR